MGRDDGETPWMRRCRELARRTGTLVSADELARESGGALVRVDVLEYELAPGGRVEPPRRIEVTCDPSATDGVRRTMSRLLDSRGWSATVTARSATAARGRDGD